jgi:hypothetical protein
MKRAFALVRSLPAARLMSMLHWLLLVLEALDKKGHVGTRHSNKSNAKCPANYVMVRQACRPAFKTALPDILISNGHLKR